ncbi:MAG: hypothetical protein D8M58_19210 [Calditrichaeota bacterium]|nr:MAG: hypothetical protein DWQ03_21890 [Calditrichota bacterium]MBL1207541.1 hypothetical protein [Calditrichota bacterium]NOG47373.1 hypothetical protein [Calditrichota bacterium]
MRILLIILFATVTSWSNPLDATQTDKQIISFTFDGQVDKADSLLNLMISKNPESPKYYALKTPFYFYSRYFGPGGPNSNDSLKNLILLDGQKAIDIADERDDLGSKFYAGLASAFISRVHITRGEYWDAFWAADDAEDFFEDVLDEVPGNVDAIMAASIREYFVENNVTGFTYFVAWIFGFSGEKQHALDNLQMVATEGEFFKTEAQFALAIINRFQENNLDLALESLKDLNQRFPNNNFIRNQARQADFIALVNDKGVDFLVAEIDTLRVKYSINNAGTLNNLGYQFINQNRLEEAIKIFKTNLNLFPEVANCYDSLAEGYMTNGQNDLAIKYYRIAYEKIDGDSTANEQFKQTLKEGIETRLEEMGATVNI